MGQSGKHVKELGFDEFNNLINELDLLQIPYNIKETVWSVTLTTNSKKYKFKFLNNINDVDASVISKQFHKITNYHYLESDPELAKLYGYKVKILSDGRRKIYWDIATAIGLTYTNNKYRSKFYNCFSYDINSAFSYAMLQKMPNTKQLPRLHDIVGENEIGFDKDGSAYIEVGTPADYIFPLIESPFKNYVYEYYELKQKETNKQKRKAYKLWLNIPTGVLQRHNIFLRNAVIMYSNKYIEKYIDENTIYCNTDSIVSLKRRNDIPIGNDIGQFKEEHRNEKFKFIKTGIYQWNTECHYKGVNGSYISDIEHIDGWFDKQINNLPYKYNKETRRIEKLWPNVEEKK